ncbi:acyltransferase domain-containing protein [Streptomyces sp. NPDC020917]|uniref:acyltransferase domain-containing protein n=1 Tax=Streptomyces sp. NPDC020917 TaxID=3365102 RepID=UPI0037BB5550
MGDEARVPRGVVLAETLLDFGVPYAEVDGVLAAAERVAGDRTASGLLADAVGEFTRDMGAVGGGPDGGPRLGPDLEAYAARAGDVAGPWFALLVLAATRPHTAAYHRALDVPEEVTRRTLADVGRHMAVHQRRRGTPGLTNTPWLSRHFRGILFQLGRLQFERTRLGGKTGRALAEAGVAEGPGAPVLAVHIPAFTGPLDAQACDASFDRARAFFARHFPDAGYAVATCHSWLLDPQLGEYLAPDSRIMAFQRRFTPAWTATDADDATTIGFVFGDPDVDPGALTARTSVQRMVLGHLAAGRHWHGGNGWLPLAPAPAAASPSPAAPAEPAESGAADPSQRSRW